MYMKLDSGEVYILPDNYKVESPSLSDIQFLLNPTFTPTQVDQLDAPDAQPSFDLRGEPYLPGFVGLNNISHNDYMNVIVQALAHVKPLRDFFVRRGPRAGPIAGQTGASDPLGSTSELAHRFGALIRKLWNPRAFKGQVSPQEFLQEVSNSSEGRFKITQQGDPVDFLGWLLNRLHMDLTGGKRKRESIITRCFQGEVRIESQKVIVRSGLEEELLNGTPEEAIDKLDHDGRKEGGQQDEHGKAKFNIEKEVQVTVSPFLLLAVELPPPPVFRDSLGKNAIPQVSISSVLAKYDGVTFQEAQGMIRRFKVKKLPPFVILHFRRFTKNQFVEERNPTVVNFPVKGLDLGDYVDPASAPISTMYDLVCNITHEATAGSVRDNSVYRSQVHTRMDGARVGKQGAEGDERSGVATEERWFQQQDLIVEELNKQMIFLGETYIQVSVCWRSLLISEQVTDWHARVSICTDLGTQGWISGGRGSPGQSSTGSQEGAVQVRIQDVTGQTSRNDSPTRVFWTASVC